MNQIAENENSIDIDKLEKSIEFRRLFGALDGDSKIIINLLAEIRRLRAHRKCPCGGKPVEHISIGGRHWIECDLCQCCTDFFATLDTAWAAWDGVE